MQDFITRWIAQLLEKFKLENPKVFALLGALLLALTHFAEQGTVLGAFTLPEWAATALGWVAKLAMLLFGAHTFKHLPAAEQKARLGK